MSPIRSLRPFLLFLPAQAPNALLHPFPPCLVRVAHALLNHVGKVAVLVHVDVLAEGQIQAEDPPALRQVKMWPQCEHTVHTRGLRPASPATGT